MRSLAALGSKNLRINIGILSDSFSHTVSLPSGNMVAVIKKGYSGLSDWEVQPFSNSGKRIQGAIITFCFSLLSSAFQSGKITGILLRGMNLSILSPMFRVIRGPLRAIALRSAS